MFSRLIMSFVSFVTVFAFAMPANLIAAEIDENKKPVKLHAEYLDHGDRAQVDTVYHFWSTKGEQAYADGNLAEAERCFRLALADADAKKIPSQPRVTLVVNLASVLRDRHKFDESEKLFVQAVEIGRTSLKNQQAVLDYIAKQYAVLLEKTGRSTDAELIQQRAKLAFAERKQSVNSGAGKLDAIDGDDDESVAAPQPIAKQTRKSDELVDWTLTIEPITDRDDYSTLHQGTKDNIPLVSGTVDFYITSDFRPVHVVCKIIGETGWYGRCYRLIETYNGPGFGKPDTLVHVITAPCNIEPITVHMKVPFRGRVCGGRWSFEKSDLTDRAGHRIDSNGYSADLVRCE